MIKKSRFDEASRHKYGFIKIPNPEAAYDFDAPEYLLRKPTPEQRRMMMVNMIAEGDRGSHVFPIAMFAEIFAVSERTVQSDLKLLSSKGLIRIEPTYEGKKQKASRMTYIGPVRKVEERRMTSSLLYDPKASHGIRDFDWADYSFGSKGIYVDDYLLAQAMNKRDIELKIHNGTNDRSYEFLRVILKREYLKMNSDGKEEKLKEESHERRIPLFGHDEFSFRYYSYSFQGKLEGWKPPSDFSSVLLFCDNKRLGEIKRRETYSFSLSKSYKDVTGSYIDRLTIECRIVEKRKSEKKECLTGLKAEEVDALDIDSSSYSIPHREAKEGSVLLVAKLDGRIVGCISYSKDSVYDYAGEINCLYVAEKMRKKGIGRFLIDALLEKTSRRQLVMNVPENDKETERFLRHVGFRKVPKKELPTEGINTYLLC